MRSNSLRAKCFGIFGHALRTLCVCAAQTFLYGTVTVSSNLCQNRLNWFVSKSAQSQQSTEGRLPSRFSLSRLGEDTCWAFSGRCAVSTVGEFLFNFISKLKGTCVNVETCSVLFDECGALGSLRYFNLWAPCFRALRGEHIYTNTPVSWTIEDPDLT